MKRKITARLIAQSIAVLVCAFAVKQYYSTASVDQLKWILTPTTACVELLSGESFQFESHSGYISADRRFLIAASCAGVNFLLTAFLMLAARKLLFDCRSKVAWSFIPASLLTAYFVTIIANTTRILLALQLQQMDVKIGRLNPGEIHRLEGIVVYFLFLLVLFLASEQINGEVNSGPTRRLLFPLLVYYATMIGMPLANGAYRSGRTFWEYAIVVLLIPMGATVVLVAFNSWRKRIRNPRALSRSNELIRFFPQRTR
jgi:exosortase K